MGKDGWTGRRAQAARAQMKLLLPKPCCTCGKPIKKGDDAWVVHHIISRGEAIASGRAHLVWDPSNWAHQCRKCSNKSTQQGVIDKARAEGARGITSRKKTPILRDPNVAGN